MRKDHGRWRRARRGQGGHYGCKAICANISILGVDADGCFSDYAVIPEASPWKNSPSLRPEVVCVQDPLGNAVYATLVEPVSDNSVAVFGCGPVGLFAVGVARASGGTADLRDRHQRLPGFHLPIKSWASSRVWHPPSPPSIMGSAVIRCGNRLICFAKAGRFSCPTDTTCGSAAAR
jgi:hypothetical protein